MRPPDRTVSIVIPTHNRRDSLERALLALAGQSYPLAAIEVIVVADGCTDGTRDISPAKWPFVLRVTEQASRGPAAARNRGAALAGGELLIFVDDDVEVSPEFVAAHVRAHADGDPARVTVGYLPPDLQGRRDFFAIMLRAWWEAMFERMRDPAHRFKYSDLLSGNFSLGSSLFARVGGFDEALRCHEDYELGLRLLQAGAKLQFSGAAAGCHHEHTDLARALTRKRDEGRADVALARRYAALAPALPLSRAQRHLTIRGRALTKLALASPVAGDVLVAACRSLLPLLEAARLRTRWRRLLDDLLSYWYWRGVGEALAGLPVDTVRRAAAPTGADACDVDLQAGLHVAMRQIDRVAPAAMRLRWGRLAIATVPAEFGAEPLNGRHLRGLLRTTLAKRLAETLQLAELLDRTGTSESAIPLTHGASGEGPA